ncbi:unnamed protein product [Parnassius apollo]|uniref:(apollo) hypothetical protein n=1 Tax=Parnassius apollo TaxID=110799 RepID=A0A8S3X3G3_PARAO|nr:unnamed protein product [Parnassius apollo]
MSVFSELLPKIFEISKSITTNFNDDLKVAFDCLDKFEEDFLNTKGIAREKEKTNPTLQSINEDDAEANKTPDDKPMPQSSNNETANIVEKISPKVNETERASKKRSKNEVDDMSSPEQEKRLKRNASVKAKNIISRQVNLNLTQKLRREDSIEKGQLKSSRRGKNDDKENTEPIPLVKVKQEKISLPEPVNLENLAIMTEIKQELNKDEIAMPPPSAPVPKPRRVIPKEKPEEPVEEETGKQRTTRTRKQNDTQPAPPVASSRETRANSRASSRASSRAAKQSETEDEEVPKETRPKRTRGKKIISETCTENGKDSQSSQDSAIGSPTEKSRPKRTRRAQKAAEKEAEKEDAQPKAPETISPNKETLSQPEVQSPILQKKTKLNTKTAAMKLPNEKTNKSKKANDKEDCNSEVTKPNLDQQNMEDTDGKDVLDATLVIEAPKLNATVTLNSDFDKTVVLSNAAYNHVPLTPKNVNNMNQTVVIEPFNRETMVQDKPKNVAMDATVVLERLPLTTNVTDDNSLLTDDSDTPDVHTPPKKGIPAAQPSSAVKEKVQQFEELASRTTRTKTRAIAKKVDPVENHTPPDKVSKVILSAENLSKMNNLIFNGRAPQISSSASKPTSNIPTMKSNLSSSTSKLSSINKAREAAEERQKKEKEDARRKKEAMLEAKRELQRRKREEKMAAAAAAREAAERERRAAMEAAAKERKEKQAHADQGKLERLKEAERKKLELARKVAETEERRKAEEQARLQRLAEEQKRMEATRRKQMEEAEAMKKEAVIMAKEIEKRQKEYLEKQKMRSKMDGIRSTPLKSCLTGAYAVQEPVYMADGFQYLNSDSDGETPAHPVPAWSTSKARRLRLYIQSRIREGLVDRLFSVRAHSPDLREIFPGIERARLKRTSSAVWRTPPSADRRYKS